MKVMNIYHNQITSLYELKRAKNAFLMQKLGLLDILKFKKGAFKDQAPYMKFEVGKVFHTCFYSCLVILRFIEHSKLLNAPFF